MIVPMKKVHLIVQSKDKESVLKKLRDLGTVHVEHQRPLTGHVLLERHEEVNKLSRAVSILKDAKPSNDNQTKDYKWQPIVDRVLRLSVEIDAFKEDVGKRSVLISKWKPWGNFDPVEIERLRHQGVFIRLIERPVKKEIAVPEGVIVESIFKADGIERCVTISRKDIDLPFDIVPLPETSLNQMTAQQKHEQEKIDQAQKEIKEYAKYYDCLREVLIDAQDKLNFEEVGHGMLDQEHLLVLKGYCPEDSQKDLEKKAKKEKWGVLVEDVTEEDQAPTLLKNSKFVELSNPALNVIEIMPGYKEVDVSKVFIVFFTLFFGMLIGDAAYGVIFGLITLFAHIKLGKKVKDKTPFHLLYLLTGFTVIWGVLTGTYFGQQWLPDNVNPIVPWLNDPNNLQWLCFTIALVHLSIARLWSFKVKLPSTIAYAELGWLLIVWGMYFLANMFVLGQPFPEFAKWFFIVGISLAFVFMVPFKDFVKKVPQELIPFVLGIIGAGTDIVSYVRLFAVGLATVAVADAANSMPGADLPGGLNYFLFIFLHLLNMVLAAMAILVHAIRLNVLEFSGHLSLEWSGFKYNPFKKKVKTSLT